MNFKIVKSRFYTLKPLKSFGLHQEHISNKNLTITRAEKADTSVNFNEAVKYASDKWAKVENKTSVAAYGGGAVVLLWFSSTIIGAVNNIPLFPKLLELVGLAYTLWFVYRYLIFKASRQELVQDLEEIKKKKLVGISKKR